MRSHVSSSLASSVDSSIRRKILIVAVAAAAAQLGGSAFAGTLAYWRFEGNGVTAPTVGTTLTDTGGRTAIQPTGVPGFDSSGNGNTLYGFNDSFAGMQYNAAVPAATVPLTGAANSFSIQNIGSFPAANTWSRESHPTTDLEIVKPLAWTIEASILSTNTSGYRTFIGRDGNGINGDPNSAPLYFQTTPGGRLRINFTDEAGVLHIVDDSSGTIGTNSWYNVAATSDGTTLKLFRDSGLGYQQVGSLSLAGSADTRLGYDDNGSNTPGDTQWGWSVGRGRYGNLDGQNDNHGDRWFGNLDEIRISDTALTPSQFLFASTVIPTAANLTWVGGQNANTWDLNTTANFKLPTNVASTFKTGDNVTFNGTGTPSITITGILVPLTTTVSGSVDQTFDGSGGIGGSGTLVKTGTGKLTLSNVAGNNYSGGTTISGGVVELTGAGLYPSVLLGTGPIVNNGQIIANRTDTLVIPNDISGSGGIDAKHFTVLSGNSTFNGDVLVEADTLFLDSATGLGSATGKTTVQNGAQLGVFLGDFNVPEPLALEGDGNGNGVIRVGGQRSVTFSGAQTWGAASGFVGINIDGGSTITFSGPITSTTSVDIFRIGTGTLKMPASNANIFSGGLAGLTQLTGGAAKVKSLIVPNQGAVIDFTKAAIAVDYEAGSSPYADLLAMRADGRLTTSLGTGYGLGIVDNATLNSPIASLAGVAVDATSVLIRGTLLGDSNLDGTVTFPDLLTIAQNYDPTGSGKGWGNGDTNYDGVVDFVDLLALAQNYGASVPAAQAALLAYGITGSFNGDFALAMSLVPEPTSALALAGFAGVAFANRRRRATLVG